MKIVFFGTPYFAARTLQYLIEEGSHIVAVVTPPDSRKGRGKKLKSCAVKEVGIKNNIPVFILKALLTKMKLAVILLICNIQE